MFNTVFPPLCNRYTLVQVFHSRWRVYKHLKQNFKKDRVLKLELLVSNVNFSFVFKIKFVSLQSYRVTFFTVFV